MGRLTNLRPQLQGLPSRLGRMTDAQGHSATLEPWRKWYSLARWKRLRMQVLERDMFTCQCGCARLEGDTSQLVADHIKPHRGDPDLFWDPLNLQTMFKPCHDRLKQREEHRARSRGGWAKV